MEGDGVACCDAKYIHNHGGQLVSPPLPLIQTHNNVTLHHSKSNLESS